MLLTRGMIKGVSQCCAGRRSEGEGAGKVRVVFCNQPLLPHALFRCQATCNRSEETVVLKVYYMGVLPDLSQHQVRRCKQGGRGMSSNKQQQRVHSKLQAAV